MAEGLDMASARQKGVRTLHRSANSCVTSVTLKPGGAIILRHPDWSIYVTCLEGQAAVAMNDGTPIPVEPGNRIGGPGVELEVHNLSLKADCNFLALYIQEPRPMARGEA